MYSSKKVDLIAASMFIVVFLGTMMISNFGFSQEISDTKDLFKQENLIAWCIVPYDSANRTPAERIEMLKELNFSQYAYDWRHEHLPELREEISLAKGSNINITALWMWIDKEWDTTEKLSDDNEALIKIIEASGIKTQLWLGFNNNFFDYDTEAEKIAKGAEMIRYIRERVAPFDMNIGLYNHGDWFGEPDNQIKILKELNDPGIGLIYNFHHAHEQIADFPSLLRRMMPWLWTVNLNGMRKAGPKIVTIGEGNQELSMLKTLKESDFKGSIGILGHIEEEDVKVVLERNVKGLRKLEKQLD